MDVSNLKHTVHSPGRILTVGSRAETNHVLIKKAHSNGRAHCHYNISVCLDLQPIFNSKQLFSSNKILWWQNGNILLVGCIYRINYCLLFALFPKLGLLL